MSNIFDWIYTDTSKTQTPAQAQANIASLSDQLSKQTGQQLASGQISPAQAQATLNVISQDQFTDPGAAAADTFLNNATFGLLGTKDPNAPPSGPGIGSVLTDVFILGAIGAGIWALVNFGGVGFLKTLAKKSKWYAAGIVGAAGLLLWFIYHEFKKTASDTASTAQGVSAGIKALNPFA